MDHHAPTVGQLVASHEPAGAGPVASYHLSRERFVGACWPRVPTSW